MAAKSKFPWGWVVAGVGVYVVWRYVVPAVEAALGNSTNQSAYAAGLASDLSAPASAGPVNSAGQSLGSVEATALGQELQQQQTLDQSILQMVLSRITGGASGGTTQAATGQATTGPVVADNTISASTVNSLLGQLAANSAAWSAPGANQAALHAANENLRQALAASGAGTLVYNPHLGYSQVEVGGKFY